MRKTYLILLALVTLATVVFATPGFAMVSVLFTFGLALIVLLPLPYLFIGVWAMFPAFLFWNTRQLRLPLLALGALAVVLALFAPPQLADRALARDLATRGDIPPQRADMTHPIGIELHRRVGPDPDLYLKGGKTGAFYGMRPCFDLCEQLLTGGDVAWIRLVLTDDAYGNSRAHTHALFVSATSEACRAANPDLPAGKRCVLFAPDHGDPADLLIVLDEDRTLWRPHPLKPYQPLGFRSATAYAGANPQAPRLYQATQLYHQRPTGQIMINSGILGNADPGGGLMLRRSHAATDEIDLTGAIQGLGLALGPVRVPLPKEPGNEGKSYTKTPPDAQDTAYVASMLAAGPSPRDRYSNAFKSIVDRWHQRLFWKSKPTDTERAVVCATAADTRFERFFNLDKLVEKHAISCP